MHISRNQYRMLNSALLIAAFFLPAYNNISAVQFIGLAIGTVQTDAEVSLTDLLLVLTPLLFIPVSAFIILLRAAMRKPTTGLLLSLPFLFLLFFSLLLSFDLSRQVTDPGLFSILKEVCPGYYISASAAVLLLLSYRRRESAEIPSEQ